MARGGGPREITAKKKSGRFDELESIYFVGSKAYIVSKDLLSHVTQSAKRVVLLIVKQHTAKTVVSGSRGAPLARVPGDSEKIHRIIMTVRAQNLKLRHSRVPRENVIPKQKSETKDSSRE